VYLKGCLYPARAYRSKGDIMPYEDAIDDGEPIVDTGMA
jgi:hypothetical protein